MDFNKLSAMLGISPEEAAQWWQTQDPATQQDMQFNMDWLDRTDLMGMGDMNPILGFIRGNLRKKFDETRGQMTLDRANKSDQEKKDREAERAGVTRQLQEFVTGLQRPIQNPDGSYADSIAQQLARSGATSAGSAARNQGLGGGISVAAAQQGTQAALLPYLQQRKQMEMQGLGMVNNRDISLGQLRQGAAQLDMQNAQMQQQGAMNQWAQQQNQRQGMGALVGGGIGLAFGGPAGASVGSSLGSGVMGLGSGNAPPTYRNPNLGGTY